MGDGQGWGGEGARRKGITSREGSINKCRQEINTAHAEAAVLCSAKWGRVGATEEWEQQGWALYARLGQPLKDLKQVFFFPPTLYKADSSWGEVIIGKEKEAETPVRRPLLGSHGRY